MIYSLEDTFVSVQLFDCFSIFGRPPGATPLPRAWSPATCISSKCLPLTRRASRSPSSPATPSWPRIPTDHQDNQGSHLSSTSTTSRSHSGGQSQRTTEDDQSHITSFKRRTSSVSVIPFLKRQGYTLHQYLLHDLFKVVGSTPWSPTTPTALPQSMTWRRECRAWARANGTNSASLLWTKPESRTHLRKRDLTYADTKTVSLGLMHSPMLGFFVVLSTYTHYDI